jgi:hypothetical protein
VLPAADRAMHTPSVPDGIGQRMMNMPKLAAKMT